MVSLNLENVGAGDAALHTLCRTLQDVSALCTLVLRENRVGVSAATALSLMVSGERPPKAVLRRKAGGTSPTHATHPPGEIVRAAYATGVEMLISTKSREPPHASLTELDLSGVQLSVAASLCLLEGLDRCLRLKVTAQLPLLLLLVAGAPPSCRLSLEGLQL